MSDYTLLGGTTGAFFESQFDNQMTISDSGLVEGSLLKGLDLMATYTFTENNLSEAWLDSSPHGATVTTYLDSAHYSHFDSSGINEYVDSNPDLEPITSSIDLPFLHQGLPILDESPILPFSSTEPSFESFTGQLSECLETSLSSAFDNSRYVFSSI